MVKFTAIIKKFTNQGEKTGWTYIDVPLDIAEKLKPDNKRSFKVKGKLDAFKIEGKSLLPMGEGNFILALDATIRKGIKKEKGDKITVQLEIDKKVKPLSEDFITCLEDEPRALSYFKTLAPSHQKYFSQWIESAKTDTTKTKRIAMAVNALSMKMGYGEMLRANRKKQEE